MAVMRAVLSSLFWTYLAISASVLLGIALVLWLPSRVVDRTGWLLHRLTSWWGWHYVALWPWWRITVVGRERLPRGPAVLAPNHQSMADILAIFGLFAHFKWVSKAEVFRVPVIGPILRLNRYVPIRRGDPASAAAMLAACRRHLAEGTSIVLFPEGTRTRDGALLPFRHGAFKLAIEARVPVVPIVVFDTFAALPPSGWVLAERVDARVEVLPAIPWDATGGDVAALAALTRDRIATRLAELEAGRSERAVAQAKRLGRRWETTPR